MPIVSPEAIKTLTALFETFVTKALEEREDTATYTAIVLRYSQAQLKAKIGETIEGLQKRLKDLEASADPVCGCSKESVAEAIGDRIAYLTRVSENLAPGHFDLDAREVDALLSAGTMHNRSHPSSLGSLLGAAMAPPRA